MSFPRKYSLDFIDAIVQRVAAARAQGHRGPITAVARELNIDRRLVQQWVGRTRTPAGGTDTASPQPAPLDTVPPPPTLPSGLLVCRTCQQPMHTTDDGGQVGYQCPRACRRLPLGAATVADTVGRTVLRHTPGIVTTLGHPKPAELAAAHAARVITRITAGTLPTDLRFTWRRALAPIPGQPGPALTERLPSARALATTDPIRAHEALRDTLTGVDPAAADPNPTLADAARLHAELLTRLGNPAAAVRWAAYAHHSHAHLHGPAARPTLAAAHTLATAHRHAGRHQRAYHVYRNLADQLTATAGPHAHPTLATQATLALVLRDLGHCAAARTLLADTITAHRRTHPHHPATARMLHHLHQMRQHCADHGHEHPENELDTGQEQRQHSRAAH
ncbi:tetratricopeptide repeat protein [Micromonospora chalcea]|uniref:tetratricopeptide repeat protein n=1 Tax=Micromonospora chalcea TaxID=1874 RepID=UPI00382B4B45